MAYGLKTKNNNGAIQIDSTYRNLSLDESGAGITVTNDNGSPTYYTTLITIASSPLVPLMLIRPNTDRFLSVRSYQQTGNNFSGINLMTEASLSGSISTTIDWKNYRENRTASGESYGLLVYNDSGKLCFDSGKSYFKIHSVSTINLGVPSVTTGPYIDITHSGISNPFYILTPSSFYVTPRPISTIPPRVFQQYNWTVGVKKLTSTSVRVGWFTYFTVLLGGGFVAEGYNPTLKLLVCEP